MSELLTKVDKRIQNNDNKVEIYCLRLYYTDILYGHLAVEDTKPPSTRITNTQIFCFIRSSTEHCADMGTKF